jgi:hypothetical protein
MKMNLPKTLLARRIFYFMTAFLAISLIVLWFVHPNRSIDLVVNTEKLIMATEENQQGYLTLLKNIPVSSLGFGGIDTLELSIADAQWPSGCENFRMVETMRIGKGKLLLTPGTEGKELVRFDCSGLKITELSTRGNCEIEFRIRNPETQNQMLISLRGGQFRLVIELLDDRIRFWSRDYRVLAQYAGQNVDISAENRAAFYFQPSEHQRSILLSGRPKNFNLHYDFIEMNAEAEDLLKVSNRFKRIEFHDKSLQQGNTFSTIATQCEFFAAGDQPKSGWSGRTIYIKKEDLSDFQIMSVKSTEPGRLRVTLRGNSATFRAGLERDKLLNRVPSALSGGKTQVGLALGVLLWAVCLVVVISKR